MDEKQLESQLASLFSDFVVLEPGSLPASERAVPGEPLIRPSKVEAAETTAKVRTVPSRVLIAQSDLKSAQILRDFFAQQGSQVWQATSLAQIRSLVEHHKPGLVVADWGPHNNGWLSVLRELRQRYPNTKVLLTKAYPGPQPEGPANTSTEQVSSHQPFARADVVPVFPSENGADPTLGRPGLLGRLKRLARAIIDLEFIWPPEA